MEQGDGKLRELERAAGQGDDAADHRYLAALHRRLGDDVASQARFLEGRLRVEQVTRPRVELAARLGHEAAQAVVGESAVSTSPGPWLEELQRRWQAIDDLAAERTFARAVLRLLRPLAREGLHPLKDAVLTYAEARLACPVCFWGGCEEHDDEEVGLMQSLAESPGDDGVLLFLVLGQLPVVGAFGDAAWAEARAAFLGELLAPLGGPPCALCGAACEETPVECEYCHHAHHPDCLIEALVAAPSLWVDFDAVVFECGHCELETDVPRDVLAKVEDRRGPGQATPVSNLARRLREDQEQGAVNHLMLGLLLALAFGVMALLLLVLSSGR